MLSYDHLLSLEYNFARAQSGSVFVLCHRFAVVALSFASLAGRFGQGNEVCPPLQIREISERKNGEKTR